MLIQIFRYKDQEINNHTLEYRIVVPISRDDTKHLELLPYLVFFVVILVFCKFDPYASPIMET